MALKPTTLSSLRGGDTCVVDDGNYTRVAGQYVIVVATGTASDFGPPPSETRLPVLVPESGRLLLLAPTTPVLVEG